MVSIDLLENQVGIKEACRNGLQSFSPRDDQVAVVDMERKAIRIIRSNCEEIGVLNAPDDIELKETVPVYSGDGKYLAAFLIDGSLAVYQFGPGERQLIGVIRPGSYVLRRQWQ